MWPVAARGESSLLIAPEEAVKVSNKHFWKHHHAPPQAIPQSMSGRKFSEVWPSWWIVWINEQIPPLDDNWSHRALLNKWRCNRTIEQLKHWRRSFVNKWQLCGKHNWKMAFWHQEIGRKWQTVSHSASPNKDKEPLPRRRNPQMGERWTILEGDLPQCSGQWPVTVH